MPLEPLPLIALSPSWMTPFTIPPIAPIPMAPSGVTAVAVHVPGAVHSPAARYMPKNDAVKQGFIDEAGQAAHCPTAVGSGAASVRLFIITSPLSVNGTAAPPG